MSDEHLDDEKLQAFFDGELEAGEADAVSRAVSGSERAQAQLAQLGRLSDLLKLAADDVSVDLPADDMFAQIRTTLEEEKRLGRNQGLQVIEGGAMRSRSSHAAPTEAAGARWGVVGAAMALAAAAVMAFYFAGTADQETARNHSSHPDEGRVRVATNDVVEESGTMTQVLEEAPPGSEVVEFDFGHNSGTIFHVQGDLGQPLAVVWIDDGGEP